MPEVECELTEKSLPWTRFKTAEENGTLEVKTPNREHVESIEEASKRVGDLLFLSKADKQVLALALELKSKGYVPQIVTDDYSIQNVANKVDIEFKPLLTYGIRYRFQWKLYCPACHRRHPADYRLEHCSICGTELKRKPIGRTRIRDER